MTHKELLTKLLKEQTVISVYTLEELEEENIYDYKCEDIPYDYLYCKKDDYFNLFEVRVDAVKKICQLVKNDAELMSELLESILTTEGEFLELIKRTYKTNENRANYVILLYCFSNSTKLKRTATAEENMRAIGFADDVIEAYKKLEDKYLKGDN